MTKVSWKRILQRAGNDLPNHGRPHPERPRVQQLPRGPRPVDRGGEAPGMIAGELEGELRRALQRAQRSSNSESQDPAWDPIFVAQELRHTPPAVPVASYPDMQAKRRSGSMTRNFIAASLSVAIVGIGVHQLTDRFGGGGGGGGGDDTTGQQQSQNASLAVPGKDQGRIGPTGYAIQPLVHPGSPADLGPVYKETPPLLADEKPGREEEIAADAAAAFKRDMEEAVKLFENKNPPAPAVAAAPPAAVAPAARATAPAAPAPTPPITVAATAPANVMPQISGVEEEKLLQRASGLMKRGDITGARLLFEHLAYRGSALGAFALAQSFDPRYLEKLYIRGLAADQKQADYWYRRAAELGADKAPVAGGRARR